MSVRAIERSATIIIPHTPPSKNTNLSRSDWKGKAQAKKTWERMIVDELVRIGLQRPISHVGPVRVFITLRFPKNNGQEPENYRPLISEWTGDGCRKPYDHVINGSWLKDDKKQDWRLSLDISDERGPNLTTIRLMWLYVEGLDETQEEDKEDKDLQEQVEVVDHVKHFKKGPIFDANPDTRIDHPVYGECVEVHCPPHKRTRDEKEKTS